MSAGTEGDNPYLFVGTKAYEFPPGLVGEIAEFIFKSAPRPVREIALAGALGLMSGICGRAFNVSGTGLNQYILVLAPTGTGKEAIASGIHRLLKALKYYIPTAQSFIGPSVISSEPALIKHLTRFPSFLSLQGEFGLRLQQLSDPRNNVSLALRRLLLDLYNKSGQFDVLNPIIYSDKDKNTDAIQSPAFSLLGESTPEAFYSSISEAMISEGLLPRFLIVEYNGPRNHLNEEHAHIEPSKSLVDRLAHLCGNALASIQTNQVINVSLDVIAAERFQHFDRYCTCKINETSDGVIRQLWNRAHIKALKLAALVAVGVSPLDHCISANIAKWAIEFVVADVENIISRFERGQVGREDFETKQMALASKLLVTYCAEETFESASKYGITPEMYRWRAVTMSFLHLKLARLAAFRHDPKGATAAIHRVVKAFVDQGLLIPMQPGQKRAMFNTEGQVWYVQDWVGVERLMK